MSAAETQSPTSRIHQLSTPFHLRVPSSSSSSSSSSLLPSVDSRLLTVVTVVTNYYCWVIGSASHTKFMKQRADPGGHCPPKDAEVALWSTALWLIHWLWNSSNKHLCLKCTKIRLPAGLRSDPLGELKRSPRHSSCNQGVLLLTALKKVALCRFALPPKIDARSALEE